MRVIGHEDVIRLLPVRECIDLMADALAGLTRGAAFQPLRSVIHLSDGTGSLYTMPASIASPAAIAVKMVTVLPRNRRLGLETHQGVVVLFGVETGEPLAVIDAGAITAVRTAAVSALATQVLAREDANDLAVIGTGVQARTHVAAIGMVRAVRRVRAWSPTPERLRSFVNDAASLVEAPVEAATSAREAVRGADIICCVTSARSPVVEGAWVAPGAHVNAVGASTPDARELDTALIARARVYVDRRESALAEAGDVLLPIAEGSVGVEHIRGELGEVLTGGVAGRESPDDITVFKSLGLAVEDVAAAHHVHAAAVRAGLGTEVSLQNAYAHSARHSQVLQ